MDIEVLEDSIAKDGDYGDLELQKLCSDDNMALAERYMNKYYGYVRWAESA